MTTFYENAGKRIMLKRIEKGYSREALAEASSISSKFLYEIETGRKGFSAEVLYRISKALQVDCAYIMLGTEKKNELGSLEKQT